MKTELTGQAFDDLAHCLRRLTEAVVQARRGLLTDDPAEATGNVEAALTSVLNAFHAIYDILLDAPGRPGEEWRTIGPLSTVLAIRNARQHNKANRIRTHYRMHMDRCPLPGQAKDYVFVDRPIPGGIDGTQLFVSWEDISTLLEMTPQESRLSVAARSTMEDYLDAHRLEEEAARFGQTEVSVVIDVFLVLTDAGVAMMPFLSGRLVSLSMEGGAFRDLFENGLTGRGSRRRIRLGPFSFRG